MPLAIDTSGLHPSTEACLALLQGLQDQHFRHILDMGCGSGILSLAAAHIWDAKVLAADISEKAVEDAKAAVTAHDLEGQITVVRSEGFLHPEIARRAPYDLIMANLVAETHLKLAQDLKKHISPKGYCLLSGVLSWLTQGVEEAVSHLGFEIVDKMAVTPWQAYVLCHKSSA